ncbi:MAG: MalY/PatB family protein, partial [Eubacteriales bacterium]
DMDFRTAPEIVDTIVRRAEHGVFGYASLPKEWYDAYIGWWERRHGIRFEKDSLIFCTGVIAAISAIVRKLTTPGEKVLLMTPVYNTFYNSILNNGRVPLESPMIYENYAYSIDFPDLEAKLADPQTSMMILCNPHNPVGKIWDRETLAKIGELCEKYRVSVISDEIHCDLTDPGREYVPFASVNETCKRISVTCIAPTKTFNLAGLHTAAIMVSDPNLRHKVWRGVNTDEVGEPNTFATVAAISAYNQGEQWLDELREYLRDNKQLVRSYTEKEIPGVIAIPSEATYLLWLDCSDVTDDSASLAAFLRRETGLWLAEGSKYSGNGRYFLRLNIACPRSLLEDGLGRLKKGISAYLAEKR